MLIKFRKIQAPMYMQFRKAQKQSQPRVTWLNLSADSGSEEQGLPTSQGKNMPIEINHDCLWGKGGGKESSHTIVRNYRQ